MTDLQPLTSKRSSRDFTVTIAGQSYTIASLALLLMLAGILLPTAKFAFGLNEPTPAQLLVGVCMAMFSAVLFLWILDSTSILPFRSAWVSRSVYGAAIVSILGTSVAVYRDAFAESKYPYDGQWQITVWQTGQAAPVAQHRLLLSYSKPAEVYWGFSDAKVFPQQSTGSEPLKSRWLEITEFSPDEKRIVIEMHLDLNVISIRAEKLEIRPHAKYIAGKTGATDNIPGYEFSITRPK